MLHPFLSAASTISTNNSMAYGAKIGWISLSNAQAFARTDILQPDADGDGVSDRDEYRADTDPLDPAEQLRIVALTATPAGGTATLTWTSRPTRLYQVQSRLDLQSGSWATNSPPGLIVPDTGPTTTRSVTDAPASNRFFRVQSVRPLMP